MCFAESESSEPEIEDCEEIWDEEEGQVIEELQLHPLLSLILNFSPHHYSHVLFLSGFCIFSCSCKQL